jgi:hypothetical protein
MPTIGFDAALHGCGEPGIELHRCQDQWGLSRPMTSVKVVEAVAAKGLAEHAVFVEIVGDCCRMVGRNRSASGRMFGIAKTQETANAMQPKKAH